MKHRIRGFKMTKKNIRIRIIACVLALITVFSVGAITVTSASATVSKPAVVRQISVGSICKTVEQFFEKGIGGVFLKTDTNNIFSSVSAKSSDQPMTTNTVLNKLDDLGKAYFRDHNIATMTVKLVNMVFDR